MRHATLGNVIRIAANGLPYTPVQQVMLAQSTIRATTGGLPAIKQALQQLQACNNWQSLVLHPGVYHRALWHTVPLPTNVCRLLHYIHACGEKLAD